MFLIQTSHTSFALQSLILLVISWLFMTCMFVTIHNMHVFHVQPVIIFPEGLPLPETDAQCKHLIAGLIKNLQEAAVRVYCLTGAVEARSHSFTIFSWPQHSVKSRVCQCKSMKSLSVYCVYFYACAHACFSVFALACVCISMCTACLHVDALNHA